MSPEEAVDAIFADLRDRRFLKWLFSEQPITVCHMVVGSNLEPLESLDADVQREIRKAWLNIVSSVTPETKP